ncbi:MAG: 50S ribosomal protein L33 [Planctomycetota bacterium]|nr:50S ribosomal protein L33 [Planctomycetota bacterium]
MVREWVFMECTDCGKRYYRTTRNPKLQAPKLELKKFCRDCRKHSMHKERKK